MKDEIIIAEARNGEVRIHAARTTAMVQEARRRHDLYPTACAALGRTMTAAALMASDLKDPREHVVVKINGNGPVGTISVQADGAGNVRGYVSQPHVYFRRADGHLDVGRAVGTDGTLTVSRDMGMKEPFTGVVPLQTGEIGDDFAYYYAASEQVRSAVAVGVLVDTDLSVKAAGGMIFQLMPGASEETIEAVEEVMKTMHPVTEYMSEETGVEDLILRLFPDAVKLGTRPVRFHCDCSKEHFADALAGLHESDLRAMIEEDHGAEITCQFCGNHYLYTEQELRDILESRKHRHEDRKRLN